MSTDPGAAPRYDVIMNIGAAFTLRTNVTQDGSPLDLSSYVATLKARTAYASGTVLFDLLSSTSPSFITLDDQGNINVDIPASVTENYPSGVYRYTLNVWPDDNEDAASRALEGIIEVRPQVVTS